MVGYHFRFCTWFAWLVKFEVTVTPAAAKHIAVPRSGADATNISTSVDINRVVAQHMALGTATKDGTVDLSTLNGDLGKIDITIGSVDFKCVVFHTLTTAKHMAAVVGMHIVNITTLVFDIHVFVAYGATVDNDIGMTIMHSAVFHPTHSGELAATENAHINPTFLDLDERVAHHATC